MDKNPISFLQEYFVKKQIMPNYSVIDSRSGTHLNWFKVRVDCGLESFDGEGSSKKEAKLNAAKGMIESLGLRNATNNEIGSALNSPNINHVSAPQNTTTSNPANNMNINFVGRLQEMAQKQGTALPVYKEKPSVGPPHNPIFTTICKLNDIEEEGTASNKKESKTLAAKKMWERINPADVKVCKSEGELKSYLESIDKGTSDLKIYEDYENAIAESADKALKLYIPLSKINVSKKVNLQDKRSYSDYHTFLRDAFSETNRELLMDKLQDTIRVCQAYKTKEDATNPMESLKLALKELNIDVKEVNVFERADKSIFGLQLDTDPVISEIGYGPTKSSAAIQSILQMAVTVSILIA